MATKFKQNLDITGNISLSGTINAQGNVTLGDADTDSVTFTADIHSNILPNTCGLMGIHLSNLYIIGSGPHRTKIAEFADPCAEKLLFFFTTNTRMFD